MKHNLILYICPYRQKVHLKIPLSILIFWVQRDSDDKAMISAVWYYNDMYLPISTEQKRKVFTDFKERKNKPVIITGTYRQILDLIMMSDKFNKGSHVLVNSFNLLDEKIKSSPGKPVLFDDAQDIKGTSLASELLVVVNETIDEIRKGLDSKNIFYLNLSKDWSYSKDISGYLRGNQK